MGKPTADVSVRIAWADDAPAIARVQIAGWSAYAAGEAPPAHDLAARWSASLAKPGDARNRVLVALERNLVTGFAVCTPCLDPDADPIADGELALLTVHPDHQGVGHGSRLVQAVAETLQADRFTRAVAWLNAADDALRGFLTTAGWAADGAHRELDLDGDGTHTARQVRLHTALA